MELLLARVATVTNIAHEMLRTNDQLDAELANRTPVLPVQMLLRLSEADGLAVIRNGHVFLLAGALDAGSTSPAWNQRRWSELALEISGALHDRQEATVLLGLERLYRKRSELNLGQTIGGSIALAKTWKSSASDWTAVVVLVPLTSFYPLLHLSSEEYVTGNYDYLVDCEGYLMVHPRPYLVSGTGPDGRQLAAASNDSEVGNLPLNTRDSDWIAGGDVLSKAFNAMVRGQPRSVVYKNLRKEHRLTSFRLINLEKQKIDGCFGIVAGRGLNALEAVTSPLLLQSSTALGGVLNLLLGTYLLLVGFWLTLTMKIRSLHNDLLAWSRFASPETVGTLNLVPIRNAPVEPCVFPDMVGLIITLDLSTCDRSQLSALFNEVGAIASKMREDGWIVSNWSLRSIFVSRPLKERGDSSRVWTPSNVIDYIRSLRLEADEGLFRIGSVPYRIVYGIGELRLHASRTGPMRRAVISLLGSVLTDTLHLDEVHGQRSDSTWGWLVYFPNDIQAYGFSLSGEETLHEGRRIRRLGLPS